MVISRQQAIFCTGISSSHSLLSCRTSHILLLEQQVLSQPSCQLAVTTWRSLPSACMVTVPSPSDTLSYATLLSWSLAKAGKQVKTSLNTTIDEQMLCKSLSVSILWLNSVQTVKKYQSVYQWLLTTHHRINTEKNQSTTLEFIENVDLCP